MMHTFNICYEAEQQKIWFKITIQEEANKNRFHWTITSCLLWNQSDIKTQNHMPLLLLPPKYAYKSEVRKWNLISQHSQKQTFKLKNSRMAMLKFWKKSMWIKVFIRGQKHVTINVTKRKMKHFQKSHVHEPSLKTTSERIS